MADLPTAAQVTELLSLLAPGLIIATVRTRAATGSVPDFKDKLLAYGLISVLYFAAVTPLFNVAGGVALDLWFWKFLQYFAVPVIIGIALAYAHQHRLPYRVAETFKLQLAHHLRAAWDYTFQNIPAGTFILAKLTDGSEVPGRMGR